jgi:hypothetical protein
VVNGQQARYTTTLFCRTRDASDAHGRCDAPGRTLRVVLDTCILKLATFPADNNASALIYERARAGLTEVWVSPPAFLEEYADVPRNSIVDG